MIRIKKYENEEICNSDKIINFNSYKPSDIYYVGGETYFNTSYDAVFQKQKVSFGPVSMVQRGASSYGSNVITHFAENFKSFKINGIEQITTPGQSGSLYLNSPLRNDTSTHVTPREAYIFSDIVGIPTSATIKKLDLARELTEFDSIIEIYGDYCSVFCHDPEGVPYFDINNAFIHEEGTTVYEPNTEYTTSTFDTYSPETIFVCAVSNPNGRILSPNDIIPMSITYISEEDTEETIDVTPDALQKKIIGDSFPVDFTEDITEVTFTFDRELTENDMVIITMATSPKAYDDPNYKDIWLNNEYCSIDGTYMFDDSFVSPYVTMPPSFEHISDSTYRLDISLFGGARILSIIGYTDGMLKDESNPFPNSVDECVGATINVSGYVLDGDKYYAEFEFTDEFIANINSGIMPAGMIQSTFMNSCIIEMKASGLKKLRAIEPDMFYYSTLQRIELPNTLTHISAGAFAYSQLGHITIPKSVQYIGANAFKTSTEFKHVDEFFTNNSSLDMVTNDYWGANVYETLTNDGVYIRGTHVVGCIQEYENVVIPEGIEYIDSYAFYNNTALKHITFPSTLKVIDTDAFAYCNNLQEAIIPEGVTKLTGFEYCTSLKKIVIPSTIQEINSTMFKGVIIESSNFTCNTGWINSRKLFLGAIIYDEIRDNCYMNGTYALGLVDKTISEIVVPEGATHMRPLWESTNATKITLPSTLTNIFSEDIYYGIRSLNEIVCNATTQPQLSGSYSRYIFYNVANDGVLKVPTGSDYSTWMSTSYYYLGYRNWTIEYI